MNARAASASASAATTSVSSVTRSRRATTRVPSAVGRRESLAWTIALGGLLSAKPRVAMANERYATTTTTTTTTWLRALRNRIKTRDVLRRAPSTRSRNERGLRGLTRRRHLNPKRSDADEDVRKAIRQALAASVPKTKCPAVLRLVFHDAGTYLESANDGGMNASVRYELNRPESFGLKRGLSVVKNAYDALEGTAAEGKVSFSDMIACAGAYAVEFTGGPTFLERVRLGRVDVSEADPENRMPEQTLNGRDMREHFARSGITTKDMVALAGAHTIGGKGFGDAYTFDNAYYATLVADPWHKPDMTKDEAEMAEHIGLPSDKFMREDEENMRWIQKYANDQDAFFADFVDAYLRLTELGAKFV